MQSTHLKGSDDETIPYIQKDASPLLMKHNENITAGVHVMNAKMNKKRLSILSLAVIGTLYGASPASAAMILDSELSSFAVLGASTVTNTGATILNGNLGVSPGTAITGFFGTVENDGPGIVNGTVHQTDATASLAQSQLGSALTTLDAMGAGTLLGADLAGLTLNPGVYTVPAGTSNLTGILNLDGLGADDATWVFQMPSTLITSPGSIVNLVDPGANAGVYWNVGSSATLDTTTLFQGNILASTSITMNAGATIGCGSALANTGAVTLNTNTISTGCNGLSPVPVPAAVWLFGSGLLGLIGVARRKIE